MAHYAIVRLGQHVDQMMSSPTQKPARIRQQRRIVILKHLAEIQCGQLADIPFVRLHHIQRVVVRMIERVVPCLTPSPARSLVMFLKRRSIPVGIIVGRLLSSALAIDKSIRFFGSWLFFLSTHSFPSFTTNVQHTCINGFVDKFPEQRVVTRVSLAAILHPFWAIGQQNLKKELITLTSVRFGRPLYTFYEKMLTSFPVVVFE